MANNELITSSQDIVAVTNAGIGVLQTGFGNITNMIQASTNAKMAKMQKQVEIARINAEKEKEALRLKAETEVQALRIDAQKDVFKKLVDASVHIMDSKLEIVKQQQQNIHEFFLAQTDALTKQEEAINARLADCDDFDEIAKLEPLATDLHQTRIKLSNIYVQVNNQISKRIELMKLDAADPTRMLLLQQDEAN